MSLIETIYGPLCGPLSSMGFSDCEEPAMSLHILFHSLLVSYAAGACGSCPHELG